MVPWWDQHKGAECHEQVARNRLGGRCRGRRTCSSSGAQPSGRRHGDEQGRRSAAADRDGRCACRGEQHPGGHSSFAAIRCAGRPGRSPASTPRSSRARWRRIFRRPCRARSRARRSWQANRSPPRTSCTPTRWASWPAQLSPGMRAVSIAISTESGAGGFILPNDRVDILMTTQISDNPRTLCHARASEGYSRARHRPDL